MRHGRVIAAGAAALAVAACAPRYAPPPPMPAGATVRVARTPDSTRAFFDSLAAARGRDSSIAAATPFDARAWAADSLAGVAWLDILRDTTLVVWLEDIALRQNRTVQAAMARVREYRAEARVARAPELPSLTVNGSESTNQIALGAFPPVAYRAARVTGDVSWELDFWGRVRRGALAATADADAQEAAEHGVVLSLVSDVATAYLQLLELDQEQAIAGRTLASRRATLGLARERFRQGVISELDVRQFEAQAAAPAVTLAETERARAEAEHRLSDLLGQAPGSMPRGGTLNDAVRALVVPDSVPASLLARRPDLQQAAHAYAAASARAGAAQAARLPTIMLSGSYGSQGSRPDLLFHSSTEVYQAQVGVSIPLFNFGRLSGASAAAGARAEQARLQYEQTALDALRDANDALVGVRAARDQVAAQATQAEALRHALSLAQLRYDAGLASYLDVLDAERSLFSAELALSQAQLQQLGAAVQLYKALGGSWTGAR